MTDARITLRQPSLTSGTADRNPELLRKVVEQFKVQTNPAFAATARETFCNLFVSSVTRALGCEVPHFFPVRMDPSTGHWLFREQTANMMNEWLHLEGPTNGWGKVAADEIRALANAGRVVVASYRAPKGPGHIAILLPCGDSGPLRIAQAGKECLFDEPIARGFGSLVCAVEYFAHQ